MQRYIRETEKRFANVIKQTNNTTTVLKTNVTERENIVFQFRKEDDIDVIKDSLTSEFGNVIIKKPLLPKIKIIGVPMHLETSNKTQLQNHIIERNPGIKTLVENGETFEFLFSYEVNERKSLILKCSSSIRSYLHENNDKIKIEYSLCKLYDRVHVMQCSKCCKLGHNKKIVKRMFRLVHTVPTT